MSTERELGNERMRIPPPVPAEEGEPSRRCLICANINPCREHSAADQAAELARNDRAIANLQAPQDVAGLVEGDALAQFLHDEIELPDKFVGRQWPLHDDDDGYRGDGGYVKLQPKDIVERYRDAAKQLLARYPALRPSPISHEDRPLELAAADNNHKALVAGSRAWWTARRVANGDATRPWYELTAEDRAAIGKNATRPTPETEA